MALHSGIILVGLETTRTQGLKSRSAACKVSTVHAGLWLGSERKFDSAPRDDDPVTQLLPGNKHLCSVILDLLILKGHSKVRVWARQSPQISDDPDIRHSFSSFLARPKSAQDLFLEDSGHHVTLAG